MRILVTGANGFIAKEIIARLNGDEEDHEITACVHKAYCHNVPVSKVKQIDFNQAVNTADWLPMLKDIDVVINCVGVFQTVKAKTMWQIHYAAPKALFAACEIKGIKKIIQISALGIDQVDVGYANSKLALEKFISTLKISSTIIRPGLVYGKGSYGGSSLFRGLASLPFFIFLPGGGAQLQQPVHIDDLSNIVCAALTLPDKNVLMAVGTEQLSVKNILIKLSKFIVHGFMI